MVINKIYAFGTRWAGISSTIVFILVAIFASISWRANTFVIWSCKIKIIGFKILFIATLWQVYYMHIIWQLLQFYSTILQYHFSFILHIAILFLKFISYLPPLSIQVAPFLQAPLAQASNSYWHPIPVKALLQEQFMELP